LEVKADSGQLTTPLQVGDEPGTVPVEQTKNVIVTPRAPPRLDPFGRADLHR
jgi:hypothetical protein